MSRAGDIRALGNGIECDGACTNGERAGRALEAGVGKSDIIMVGGEEVRGGAEVPGTTTFMALLVGDAPALGPSLYAFVRTASVRGVPVEADVFWQGESAGTGADSV